MEKTQLKRHDLVFLSKEGKQRIWQDISAGYCGAKKKLAEEVLIGATDVPGFVRRDDEHKGGLPLGFVHHKRLEGNRIRVGVSALEEDVMFALSPYEVLERKIYAVEGKTACLSTLARLYALSEVFSLQVGVLGSAALELVTGLPYTDAASDIDLLVKPAPYKQLLDFYKAAQVSFDGINMDFELDLPNGYGVKLAEMFMGTSTVLGKSLEDVALLSRSDVMRYLV